MLMRWHVCDRGLSQGQRLVLWLRVSGGGDHEGAEWVITHVGVVVGHKSVIQETCVRVIAVLLDKKRAQLPDKAGDRESQVNGFAPSRSDLSFGLLWLISVVCHGAMLRRDGGRSAAAGDGENDVRADTASPHIPSQEAEKERLPKSREQTKPINKKETPTTTPVMDYKTHE